MHFCASFKYSLGPIRNNGGCDANGTSYWEDGPHLQSDLNAVKAEWVTRETVSVRVRLLLFHFGIANAKTKNLIQFKHPLSLMLELKELIIAFENILALM